MSEEPFAVSKLPPPPAVERDYDSICAALMQTERGRWFLQEYARRNRSADTQVLLAAIERIEAVVCADRNRQVQAGMRSDLLEMAKAITRTRAEVAEIRADAGHPAAAGPDPEGSPQPRRPHPGDVFAAAERIREVTWAMRGHGFDPSTCDQLEELAASILSASSLRDPTDHRASKLSEVLQYLEHRIDALLESNQDGDQPASEPDHDAFEAALSEEAKAGNPFASALAAAEYEADGSEASRKTSVSPQDIVQSASVTGHDDFEEGTAALSPPPARSAAGSEEPEGSLTPPPDPLDPPCEPPAAACAGPEHGDISLPESSLAGAEAEQDAPEPPISARNHDDEAQIAEDAAPPGPDAVDETELVQGAGPTPTFADQVEALPAREPAAVADAQPAIATTRMEGSAPPFDGDAAPAVKPQESSRAEFGSKFQDSFLPQVELPQSHRLMRKSSAAQAASTALREVAARTFLPEVDMGSDRRGLNAEPARGVSLTAAMPAAAFAATSEPERPAAGLATDADPAEPAGLDLPGVPEGVEAAQIALATPAELIESIAALPLAAATPAQLAAAPLPQAHRGDPLAALKAMSEHELLALFG